MSGPAASLLLPRELDAALTGLVRDEIRRRSSEVSGDDFRVAERPFFVILGPEYPEALSETCASGLPAILGWAPRDIVTFCAAGNQELDHRLLAQLCLSFASDFGWLVDFGGPLRGWTTFPRDQPSLPFRVQNPGGLSGTLFATSYLTANGEYATAHFGDAEFLRSWLEHPDFRMVK